MGVAGCAACVLQRKFDDLGVGLPLISELDDTLGVAAHGFGRAFEHFADDAHRDGQGAVIGLNNGTAAMNTANGGSISPIPTAGANPPKYPTDRGTSTSTCPTSISMTLPGAPTLISTACRKP